MAFDPQDFSTWLADRGVITDICPACGRGRFTGMGSVLSGLAQVTEDHPDLESGYQVVPNWCDHCGFTRFFQYGLYRDQNATR